LFYDPTKLFCDEVLCTPFHDGRFVYRDQDHLSVYGSAYVGRDFGAWLERQAGARMSAVGDGAPAPLHHARSD
jgi:hypothetical protein